jgi:hypothetical protein
MAIYYDEGRCKVRVTALKFGKTDSGKLCLAFAVLPLEKLPGRPGQEAEPVYEGDERTVGFYFASPKNAEISVQELRRLGWKGTSFADRLRDGEEAWSLVGQALTARCWYDDFTRDDGTTRQVEKWAFATAQRSVNERVQSVEQMAQALPIQEVRVLLCHRTLAMTAGLYARLGLDDVWGYV